MALTVAYSRPHVWLARIFRHGSRRSRLNFWTCLQDTWTDNLRICYLDIPAALPVILDSRHIVVYVFSSRVVCLKAAQVGSIGSTIGLDESSLGCYRNDLADARWATTYVKAFYSLNFSFMYYIMLRGYFKAAHYILADGGWAACVMSLFQVYSAIFSIKKGIFQQCLGLLLETLS